MNVWPNSLLIKKVAHVSTSLNNVMPFRHSADDMSSVESQKGAITIQRCCHHSNCTAIAPFRISMEHLWISIAPFWLSTDDMITTWKCALYIYISMIVWSKVEKQDLQNDVFWSFINVNYANLFLVCLTVYIFFAYNHLQVTTCM